VSNIRIGDICIGRIAAECAELETLILASTFTTDKAMSSIAKHCPRLRKINLNGCMGVKDAGVAVLAAALVNLQDISLPPLCSDFAVKQLAALCPALRQIELSHPVTEAGLKIIADACLNIVSVNAQHCEINSAAFIYLAERRHALTSLKLCSRITDSALSYIAEHCSSLVLLHICSTLYTDRLSEFITDSSLLHLCQFCPQLQSVELNHCVLLTADSVVLFIQTCTNLSHLSLFGCSFLPAPILNAIAANSRQLESLNLSSIPKMIEVSDADLAVLVSSCPKLKWIALDSRFLESRRLARLRTDLTIKVVINSYEQYW
jgi:hypothetical protein